MASGGVGPYTQDLLTRIINVHWGGGVFIAGDLYSNIYRLSLGGETGQDGKPVWTNLGRLDFAKEEEEGERSFVTGRVTGSAFANTGGDDSKPVFILTGGSGLNDEIGIIMASRDGSNWERVFTFKGNENSDYYIGAGIFGVVWNEDDQMFYAGGHQSDNFVESFEFAWSAETDILFQSSDGYSWSEVGRHETRIDIIEGEVPPYPDYTTGLLVARCGDLVKDGNSNAVPGGNYGYNKGGQVLVAPTVTSKIDYLYGNFIQDIPDGTSVTVTSFGEGAPPSYPSDTGIPTTCVANVGGEWVAAGGTFDTFDSGSCQAVILTSSGEDGPTWERIDPPGVNVIITMTGGLLSSTDAGL